MRDEEYKSFLKKITPIIKDCTVTKQIAESDPEKYGLHKMRHPYIEGFAIGYDKEKTKEHTNTLREIFTEIPRGKLLSQPVVFSQDLISDKVLSETDEAKKLNLIKQQLIVAETFLAISRLVGIVYPLGATEKNPNVFYALMKERIPTNYKDHTIKDRE